MNNPTNDFFTHPNEDGRFESNCPLRFSPFAVETNDSFFNKEENSYYGALQVPYDELLSSVKLTSHQSLVFHKLLGQLAYGCECPSLLLSSIKLTFSEEEGIIIYRNSERGVSFIAIDDEGDSMFSFSPYQGEGERIFFDYNSDAEEAMAYRLLAK